MDESTGKIDVVYDSMYSFDDSKIMTEDTATNETESTETSDAPDNSSSNKFILGGIEFEIIESSIDGTTLRLYYKNKIRDIKKVKKIYADMKKKGITEREFDIRTLRNKPAFVNDVDIHRRLFRQKVVRNKACNQV